MITLREYEPGEVILRQHDDGDAAYTIVAGKVQVSREIGAETLDLGFLGPGEIFGEMGMIDDRPRSATVTATEATTLREIHRDEFLENLQTHPAVAMNLLRAIFERLRQAHSTIAQLQAGHDHPKSEAPQRLDERRPPLSIRGCRVWLEGLTPRAAESLPRNPLEISRLPFRIGRATRDPLAHNDLSLADEEPLQISRHHVSLVRSDNRLGIVDRGSSLGGQVDGEQLGGSEGYPGPIYLHGPESLLTLGGPGSTFQFKIQIVPGKGERS